MPSFKVREARQDVEPERRFSARWWPVEDEFQGSNILRVGGGAGEMGRWAGGIMWG